VRAAAARGGRGPLGAGPRRNALSGLTPGYRFDLKGHYRPDFNQPIRWSGWSTRAERGWESGSKASFHYENRVNAIPHSVVYRPQRVTPKPVIQGAQTAVVVGSPGSEIWVDKYGRVKVQFRWDREGQHDDRSSCWVRVAQGWAGKGWGWRSGRGWARKSLWTFWKGIQTGRS